MGTARIADAALFESAATSSATTVAMATAAASSALVGCDIVVYWPLDKAWYAGTVVNFAVDSAGQSQHTIRYTQDLVEEALNLENERYKVSAAPTKDIVPDVPELTHTGDLPLPLPVPGEMIHDPGHNRRVYATFDDETPFGIAEKFDVGVQRVVADNKPLHTGLATYKKLKPGTIIVLPFCEDSWEADQAAVVLAAALDGRWLASRKRLWKRQIARRKHQNRKRELSAATLSASTQEVTELKRHVRRLTRTSSGVEAKSDAAADSDGEDDFNDENRLHRGTLVEVDWRDGKVYTGKIVNSCKKFSYEVLFKVDNTIGIGLSVSENGLRPLEKQLSGAHRVYSGRNGNGNGTDNNNGNGNGNSTTSSSLPMPVPAGAERWKPGQPDNGRYGCAVCSLSFATKADLENHYYSLEHNERLDVLTYPPVSELPAVSAGSSLPAGADKFASAIARGKVAKAAWEQFVHDQDTTRVTKLTLNSNSNSNSNGNEASADVTRSGTDIKTGATGTWLGGSTPREFIVKEVDNTRFTEGGLLIEFVAAHLYGAQEWVPINSTDLVLNDAGHTFAGGAVHKIHSANDTASAATNGVGKFLANTKRRAVESEKELPRQNKRPRNDNPFNP